MSDRKRALKLGISSYTENEVVLDIIGNVNISGVGVSNSLVLSSDGSATIGEVTITTSGIVTSSNPGVSTVVYYGDGSNLFGVSAFNVIAQDLSNNAVYPTFASNTGVTSVGISTSNFVFIPSLGYVGIGTTNPTSKLYVGGDGYFTGILTANRIFSEVYGEFIGGPISGTDIVGIALSISGISTLGTVQISSGIVTATSGVVTYYGDGSKLTGVYAPTSGIASYADNAGIATYADTAGIATVSQGLTGTPNITVGIVTASSFIGSGTSITDLNATNLTSGIVPAARITSTSALTVGGDLFVSGNISFGGTTTQLNTTQLVFSDPDLVLGVGTTGSFSPTDNTANHGGIAIASTEGSPLVTLSISPLEVLPDTYKKFMWFKNNTSGLGTDAWLSNYAVGIGSTQFPFGTRFASGNIQFTENDISIVRNINSSGIITASSFVGDLTGTALSISGISTLGTVQVSSGIVTATSGVVTYYGDGSNLSNIVTRVGIQSEGANIGTASTINFTGSNITSVTVSAGIATINISETAISPVMMSMIF